jgi:hypothetical protein
MINLKELAAFIVTWILFVLVLSVVTPAKAMSYEWMMDANGTPVLGGSIIILTGEIVPGDAEVLKENLDRFPAIHTVMLEGNPGGSVMEAIEVGRLLNQRGIQTVVTGVCVSACPLVALGGLAPRVASTGLVGVHWMWWDNPTPEAGYQAQGILRDTWQYLDEVGAKSEAFMKLMLDAGQDIDVLSKNELKNIGFLE